MSCKRLRVAFLLVLVMFAVVLVVEPLPVHAASSLVQQNGVFCVGAGGAIRCGSTLSVSFSGNVASGNVVVAAVVSADVPPPPGTVTSVGDSLGSSFTQAVSAWDGYYKYAYIYYTTLTSSGPDTVTVTFSHDLSDENGFGYLYIYEVSGVTTTGVATGTGSGTFGDSNWHSISTSSTDFQTGAFLLAIMANDILSSNWGAGIGFQLSPPPHDPRGTVDEFVRLSKAEYSTSGVSPPTYFNATLSSGSGGNWIEVGAAFTPAPTYSVVFQQSGIPGGVSWGVTVGGTRYTSTTSSITRSGLSGTVAYSYDPSVPAPGGGSYTCTSGCSGSVTGPTTVTATYQPQLVVTLVSPPSPANGKTVIIPVVMFSVHVTGPGGKPISGATVTIYVNGVPASRCSGKTDSKGNFYCFFSIRPPFQASYRWYAAASKSGYASGSSPTWTFKTIYYH